MGLYVGNTRIAPVVRVNVTPNFKGVFNLITNLGLSIGATESQIATALANTITTAVQYDYCLIEIPDYQVYNGYSAFASVDDYVDYYVIYNSAYELVTNSNKSSLGIVPKTTVAYILNNAYSVVRYNFDGTDWTSADNSGYANIDASNFTDSGTTYLSKIGYPSDREETITVLASQGTYTAPANGWFRVFLRSIGTGYNQFTLERYYNDSYLSYEQRNISGAANRGTACIIPVTIGEIIRMSYYGTMSMYFIYAEGTPTPPQP